jgi:hypothetical protein
MPLRAITRLVIGPLLVGLLAGIELWRYGVAAAAAGVYLVFVAAAAMILLSGGAISCAGRVGGSPGAGGYAVGFTDCI